MISNDLVAVPSDRRLCWRFGSEREFFSSAQPAITLVILIGPVVMPVLVLVDRAMAGAVGLPGFAVITAASPCA